MSRSRFYLVAVALASCALVGCGASGGGGDGGDGTGAVTVLGYNDLGMHCMNQDFSELGVLPPFNTLHAQVIDRSGGEPHILTSGITVDYTIPGNTHSTDKTNFWTYAQALYGAAPAPNIGLTGNGLSGTMVSTGRGDWVAEGIPITPITDAGQEDPYQLATITATRGGAVVGSTRAVVPVSWEMNCNLCHPEGGGTLPTASDILQKHDELHGTNLSQQKPVACGKCHQQAPLVPFGITGNPSLPSLSRAMHSAHAPRMDDVQQQTGGVDCYACHPGIRTKCLRDVHATAGKTCVYCHGTMNEVASSTRRPWVDEPRCGTCHQRSGFTFEQAGTLFRNSKGHHGVYCEACHGTPHAITPTRVAADNIQAIAYQGHAGTIDTCTVCHQARPDDGFDHRFAGG